MRLPVPLRGVVPPLCTPLTGTGEVDARSLAALVEHLLGAGVHGVFALGTSGEAAQLTDRRRTAVLRTVVEAVAGRVPVLAGVIDTTTERVVDQARAAAAAGADALVATAPFFTGTHPVEVAAHFRRIRHAVDLPLFAYDNPGTVHTRLAAGTLLDLAAEGTLAGLKDTTGDLGGLRRLLLGLRTRGLQDAFTVLTGSELTVDAALLAGAHGVVPGLGNVDPAGYVRLHAHARAGRWSEAAAEQDRLAGLFALVEAAGPDGVSWTSAALGGYKAALHALGVIDCPATSAPLQPLSEAAVARVRQLLAEAGLT
ncbi:dihydrodipicolinate synthase family protein [Streptomyces sp. NPDC049585]|uniref:dihydrodipicolinate synthase family protein n=1 Tax=Streptomyces sp. NPDC049585 TaxID=3155154 RepID=UPI003423559F